MWSLLGKGKTAEGKLKGFLCRLAGFSDLSGIFHALVPRGRNGCFGQCEATRSTNARSSFRFQGFVPDRAISTGKAIAYRRVSVISLQPTSQLSPPIGYFIRPTNACKRTTSAQRFCSRLGYIGYFGCITIIKLLHSYRTAIGNARSPVGYNRAHWLARIRLIRWGR